jgi:hypothetical protein
MDFLVKNTSTLWLMAAGLFVAGVVQFSAYESWSGVSMVTMGLFLAILASRGKKADEQS